jgi:hypothetical protein
MWSQDDVDVLFMVCALDEKRFQEKNTGGELLEGIKHVLSLYQEHLSSAVDIIKDIRDRPG